MQRLASALLATAHRGARALRSRLLTAHGRILFGSSITVHGPFSVANVTNVTIGAGSSINDGVFIVGRESVVIGRRVTLSARVMILDAGLEVSGVNDGNRRSHAATGGVVIGDDVWIGAGSIILPGVNVGAGSVIGAGSVVVRDVDPNSVYAGVPAQRLKRL